ncbi:hypothetical protein J3F83DRAFT_772872 [Trichoderma novae-zelandiae]
MDIDMLEFSSRTLRSFICEVGGTVCPGFEIGWVSSVVLRLFYGHTLLGEATIPDLAIIPDRGINYVSITTLHLEQNGLAFDAMEIEIQNMTAFKSLFDDIMPRTGPDHGIHNTKRTTADLSVSQNGHQLTMAIDLANMPRMRCSVISINVTGKKINMAVLITNLSPIRLGCSGWCAFVLLKGQKVIGWLGSRYSIKGGEQVYTFVGTIEEGVSGMAILKGDVHDKCDKTWKRHVLGLFEVQVDLDKASSGGYEDMGDDKEDEGDEGDEGDDNDDDDDDYDDYEEEGE